MIEKDLIKTEELLNENGGKMQAEATSQKEIDDSKEIKAPPRTSGRTVKNADQNENNSEVSVATVAAAPAENKELKPTPMPRAVKVAVQKEQVAEVPAADPKASIEEKIETMSDAENNKAKIAKAKKKDKTKKEKKKAKAKDKIVKAKAKARKTKQKAKAKEKAKKAKIKAKKKERAKKKSKAKKKK